MLSGGFSEGKRNKAVTFWIKFGRNGRRWEEDHSGFARCYTKSASPKKVSQPYRALLSAFTSHLSPLTNHLTFDLSPLVFRFSRLSFCSRPLVACSPPPNVSRTSLASQGHLYSVALTGHLHQCQRGAFPFHCTVYTHTYL